MRLIIGFALCLIAAPNVFAASTSQASNEKHLIVIAAPSINDTYDDPFYANIFQDIIDFDVAYANAVIGHDDVRIVVDRETRKYFKGRVPSNILIDAYLPHIWMRDYTTINPSKPIQFRYTPASFEGDQEEADYMQDGFNAFTAKFGVRYPRTGYILDGGNIVDNYAGRIITTTRFLTDNHLSKTKGEAELKRLLNAKEIAILPPDDELLAHSDGMAMFVEKNTLIVNRYEEPFRSQVLNELKSAFPGIKIIEIDVAWDEDEEGSACGINVNATVTKNFIYMPHFGDVASDNAMRVIRQHTTKTVIPVPANKVCTLGGSVRCLTWQLSGGPSGFLKQMP